MKFGQGRLLLGKRVNQAEVDLLPQPNLDPKGFVRLLGRSSPDPVHLRLRPQLLRN